MLEIKIPLLVVSAAGLHFSVTPPTARPPAKERLKPTGWELLAPWVHHLVKGIYWSFTLSEAAVAYAAINPPSPLSRSIIRFLVRSPNPNAVVAQVGRLSPAFFAGCCFSITGALLRNHCYRVLGRFFTFELSIRKEHKLVTSGPYSIVRHPSYTGALCVAAGIALCHLNRHSWLVACSGLFPTTPDRVTRAVVGAWACLSIIANRAFVNRMKKEDAMLERAFGDEWRRWVERVPYRVIPWVY
ncbi:hypothetical protein BJ138DRAFT_1149653 [Hygrophoropsis aurantiaca]|uniref:Uncharacterized protein n=1 Tax=Hygrophoropsis aurantiaca TaxID=72124 RepID=A0ACB8AGN0_9AGAM|nr:hypothetical protein BJ138DRAFT_1149653 [Hygrophoropsis aurantiaca]